jgi:hypothetical protein
MKHYPEWNNLLEVEDLKNTYSAKYVYPNGDAFYIEPIFYYKLKSFENKVNNSLERILNEMERIVKKYHLVVFINDEDEEITEVEDAVYLTIQDVCNPLQIFVEDKSRGSDYGD